MKNILLTYGSILALFLTNACSNDLEVTSDWKSIPVIYGFLSNQDTATYIRVEKAFLSQDQSALEVAQIPDSLYYNDITVTLTGGGNEYTLTRVNGNEEGYVRESGIFADAPNYLYKLVLPEGVDYVGGQDYILMVKREDGTVVATATTTMVTDVVIRNTDIANEWKWNATNEVQHTTNVNWRINESTGSIYDVTIRLFYDEAVNGNTQNLVEKSVDWNFITNYIPDEPTGVVRQTFAAPDFFQFLGGVLSNDPGAGPRFFKSVEVTVENAGKELLEYVTVADANTGLTGANIPPVYSNIEDGFGLFTSKSLQQVIDIQIVENARDSLRNGRFTKDLNFR